MKKQLFSFLIVLFSLQQSFAQCENTVANGSFKRSLAEWSQHATGTGTGWQVNGGYEAYLDVANATGTRLLYQSVSNIAVNNGYITVLFHISIVTGPNALSVAWNNVEMLRFAKSGTSSPTVMTTHNGATVTRSTDGIFDESIFHITLKIPYSGAAPANGEIKFTVQTGGSNSGTIYLDDVFIPRHGCPELTTDIQPTFACEPGVGYIFQNRPNQNPEGVARAYTVDLLTGASTEVKSMLIDTAFSQFSEIGCIAYNIEDDYIYGMRLGTNQIVRVGSDFSVEYLPIPDLPNRFYASGDIDANGIYYLGYINPHGARESKLERVNIKKGTRETPLVIGTSVDFIDFAFSPIDNNIYAIKPGSSTRDLIRINPTTGATTVVATYSATVVGANGFGAVFFDSEGNLWASANTDGRIFRFSKVHEGTPTVSFITNGPVTSSNDGARCPYSPVADVLISGNVWNDGDGNAVKDESAERYANLGTTSSNGLWANLVNASGEVVSSSSVGIDGSYALTSLPGTYSIVLTSEQKLPGTILTASNLPERWVHTGTNVGGTANTANLTGRINNVVVNGTDIENLNFGVQQLPNTFDVEVTINQPQENDILYLNGVGTNPRLTNGSDYEDGIYLGNGSTFGTPKGIVITALPTNGSLYYNEVLVTATDVTNGTIFPNPALLSLQLTGTGYTSTSFKYAYVDRAGGVDPTPATYLLDWSFPLTLSLLDFSAKIEGSAAILNWSTASEQNNKGFDIERSEDGKTWNKINWVATLSHDGNSKTQLDYMYTDKQPINGVNYYRLKQTDFEGKTEYSAVRMVNFKIHSNINVYPNPVQNHLMLNGLSGTETVAIYDITGTEVMKGIQIGGIQATINVSDLSEGVYLVRIQDASGALSTHKIIKGK